MRALALSLFYLLAAFGANASDCLVNAEHAFSYPKPCPEVVQYYLEDVSRCNILGRKQSLNDGELMQTALEMWTRDCHQLNASHEAVLAAFADNPDVTELVNAFFTKHQLKIQFADSDAIRQPVACSVAAPYAYGAGEECPAVMQHYLSRLGQCLSLEVAPATETEPPVDTSAQRTQLMCDRLESNYHALIAEFGGDEDLMAMLDGFFEQYNIPYPSE